MGRKKKVEEIIPAEKTEIVEEYDESEHLLEEAFFLIKEGLTHGEWDHITKAYELVIGERIVPPVEKPKKKETKVEKLRRKMASKGDTEPAGEKIVADGDGDKYSISPQKKGKTTFFAAGEPSSKSNKRHPRQLRARPQEIKLPSDITVRT
jgi:hypothetical protein